MHRLPYYEQDFAFGQLMLTLRGAIGLTQASLAQHLGVSRRSVGDWEAGNNYPKPAHLKHFIELALRQKAFPTGHEEEEIRALWRTARQKVLLDEVWLDALLAPQAPPLANHRTAEGAGGAAPPPVPSPFPLATNPVDLPSAPTTNAGSHPPEATQYAPSARRERQAALRERRINLPSQVTIFFGREAELAEITRILTDPACRLLTLLGPGGVGKTRLAIEVARRLSETQSPAGEREAAFEDGVVFVPLASVNSPNQIASAIGEALHLSFAGQQHTTVHLLDHLRVRQMLLVLDDLEHLLEGVELISRILESAPGVTILATSRERLNLQAEWLFDVEGLSYPPLSQHKSAGAQPLANMVNLADYGAVQLFVQRATQIQPNLPLTDSTLMTIARISEHVVGMPLAIELAAAGVRTLTVDKIERQLRANLDVLATTFRDVPPRHRSMRAAFDDSWNLLSEPERLLFSRLAVFRGGCSVEAAEKVAGGTLQLLTTLVEKSLLRQTTPQREATTEWTARATPHAEAPAIEVRFFLLEPIREYALEKLTERGELELLQRAHIEYYIGKAEAVGAQWNSPTAEQEVAKLDHNIRAYDNMRAALQWALDTSRAEKERTTGDESGSPPALLLGLRLAAALRKYWQRRGYFSEGRAWLEQLLAQDATAPGDGGDQETTAYLTARLHAIDAAGWLASDQNDYARSEQLFEQSAALRRVLGEPEAQSSILVHAARQARAVGEYGQAISLLEDAVSRLRILGDRGGWSTGGLGMTLYELGLVKREQGDFAGASALFQETLELHRDLGDREGIAVGLLGLGDIARDRADSAQTSKYCEQSLAISRELGLQWVIGFLLNNLAWAAYLDSDFPQAASLAGEGISLFRELHAEASLAEVLITQGHILRAQGDMVRSYMAVIESLQIVYAFGQRPPRLMEAHALEALAGLLAQSKSRAAREQEPAANLVIQILGAAKALRVEMGTPARPLDRILETPELATARSTKIDATITSLWGEGNRVSLEQILSAIPRVAAFEEMLAQAQATLPEARTQGRDLRSLKGALTEDTIAVTGSALSPQHSAPSPPGAPKLPTRTDWAGALSVPHFYGREWELAMLTQWVVEEQCRVVSVLGIGGIGKSSLSIKLMHRVAPNFEAVIWRSVRDAPSCEGLIEECLQVLAPEALADLREPDGTQAPLDERINLLLKNLRNTRTLLVLDNAESLLDKGERTSHIRPDYESYGRLLRRIGESEHRSCLLLTSREKFEDLMPLEGNTSPVRVLRLSLLGPAACVQLLAEKGVRGAESEQAQLIEQYGGNPLALKIVAQTIADLFGGDAAAFQEQGQVIYGGVRDLLAEQFNRLSAMQQSIMFWLAILREPATLDELSLVMSEPVARVWLLEGVEALHRRSLVESGWQSGSGSSKRSSFALQSVVLEYVTERLILEITNDIEQGRTGESTRLVEYGIVVAQAREYVRQTQERLIVAPVLLRLRYGFPGVGRVEGHLLALLDELRTRASELHGYGPANLLALLRLQRGDLRGVDLSGLVLRSVYLQGVEMQDASLSGASIRDSVFTDAFDNMVDVAISDNGKYWAACSGQGEVRLWDVGDVGEPGGHISPTLQRIWQAPTDIVWAIALSPDGLKLAGGCWDGEIKVWDTSSGALLWSSGRYAGTGRVRSIEFSPDGNMLAAAVHDADARLWDVLTGTQLQTLPHPATVFKVKWSPGTGGPKEKEKEYLLATGDREGCIWLWEVNKDGQATCVKTLLGHTGTAAGLAFAPDGSTLASVSLDGTLKLWDMPNGHLRGTIRGHTEQMLRVAWSSDGRTLAYAGNDPTIWLWDLEQGSYRAALRGHTDRVWRIAFTPDSSILLSGSLDGTLRVWDVASGQCIRVIQGNVAALQDVDWSPDGLRLVSAGVDHLVTIHDGSGATPPIVLTRHKEPVVAVGWCPDGRRLAVMEWENSIRLYDPKSGEYLQELHHPDDPTNRFTTLGWSPDGQWLACGTESYGVLVWDMREARASFRDWAPGSAREEKVTAGSAPHPGSRWPWPPQTFLTSLSSTKVPWSPDGAYLAGGGDDGTVYVWDARDGTLLQQMTGHFGQVHDVEWSPGGRMLASGSDGEGGELFVWDTERGSRIRTFEGHPGIVFAVAWGAGAQSEEVVISGGNDGALRWWSVQSGECVAMCEAHQGRIIALKRSPDGTKLASAGLDGAIKLWDLQTGEPIRTLRLDRPYERLNITGIRGLTEAQKATLRQLGATEQG